MKLHQIVWNKRVLTSWEEHVPGLFGPWPTSLKCRTLSDIWVCLLTHPWLLNSPLRTGLAAAPTWVHLQADVPQGLVFCARTPPSPNHGF